MFMNSTDKKALQEQGIKKLRVTYSLEYSDDKKVCSQIENFGDYDDVNIKNFSNIEEAVSLFLELQDKYQHSLALQSIKTYHLQLCMEIRIDNILVYEDLITELPHGKEKQEELSTIINKVMNIKKIEPYYNWIMQEKNKYVRDIIEKDINKVWIYQGECKLSDIEGLSKDGLIEASEDKKRDYIVLRYSRKLTAIEIQQYKLKYLEDIK